MRQPVPEWRRAAAAGMPLAQAQAMQATAEVVQPSPVALGNTAMERIIMPSARDRWRGGLIHYYTPEIVETTLRSAMAGNLLAQWTMFDLMEQTWPRLAKNLAELKNAALDLDWHVEAFAPRGAKPSAEAERRAKVVEEVLWQMRPDPDADEADFEDTIFDCLDALGKGIAVQEILWTGPGEDGNDLGLWVPRATKWVHPRYYGYQSNPEGDDRLLLNMMEVRLSNPDALRAECECDFSKVAGALNLVGAGNASSMYARFPKDQFIVSIMKMKSGHPISGALLRLLGFWWAASNFAWDWFLNLAQIFGVPLRWATFATGTGSANTIGLVQDMMANLGSAGWALFPEGTQLNVAKALEGARDNPAKAFIDAADTICDTLILGQTLTTSQGDRGSQALGTVHKDVRDEKIQAVAKRASKVLGTQLLSAICRMNFGDARECPWLHPSAKESKNALDVATRYKTILSIPGVKVSAQQFYEENDLVIPQAEEDTLTGQAAGIRFGGGPGNANGNEPDGDEQGKSPGEDGNVAASARARANAQDATEKLTEAVLEDLTGVEAKWLGGVKPFFRRLVASAQSSQVTDAEFIATLDKAQREMPELFSKLDHAAVAKALEASMGAATVNGAVRGHMARRNGKR